MNPYTSKNVTDGFQALSQARRTHRRSTPLSWDLKAHLRVMKFLMERDRIFEESLLASRASSSRPKGDSRTKKPRFRSWNA